jgi:hypothetical protein
MPAVVPPPVGKYASGDRVMVRIGSRPLLPFTVLECVTQHKPTYRLDWTEHGYDKLLNTVHVAESAIVGHQNA